MLLRIKNVLTQPSVHKSMPRRTVNKGGFLQPPRAFCSLIKQSLALRCSTELLNLSHDRIISVGCINFVPKSVYEK
jgi:hypothetical protein